MQEQNQIITQAQVKSQSFLSQLHELHTNIDQDIAKMSNLKTIYHELQEKKFLVTFVNIMDRMSNELQRANDLYQSIDKEIAENEQCLFLSKELTYFQNQCVELKHNLQRKQDLYEQQQERQEMLEKEQQYLQNKLYQQTYKEMKYKNKMQALSKRSKNGLQITQSNRSYESRSKSKTRNKSVDINDNLYEQIYKKRPKSLRHATSFKVENRQNVTLYLQNKKSVNLFSTFKQC